MIKTETLGMLDVAKINPVIKAASEVANYSFYTDDGEVYLVDNTLSGDDNGRGAYNIPAGDFINGYLLKAWVGQKLVIDEIHIAYGEGEDYSDLTPGTTLLTINVDGKLEIADAAPEAGIYFAVTDKTTLTGKAIKARVMVVDGGSAAPTTLAGLTDVDLTTAPTNGQVLGYNGTKWVAANDKTE